VTEAQMRELVSSTFATGWRTAQPGVDFALENEGRKLPPSVAGSFALQTTMLTTSGQMTQGAPGSRRVRRDGWIQVKLWAPADTGASGAAGMADAVRVMLEMVELASPVAGDEPVTTGAGSTQPVGVDGKWYLTLVRIPLYFVETK
jgi:hypothetical protein